MPVPHEQSNFFRRRLAEAVHRFEPVLLHKFFKRLGQGLQRPRGMGVGADLERVLACQLEDPRDIFENRDDVVLAHKNDEPLNFTNSHSFTGGCPSVILSDFQRR